MIIVCERQDCRLGLACRFACVTEAHSPCPATVLVCPRPAGKNEKVVHRREKREAWTCVAPLYRPGYASQDVSPEESEAASDSVGGSEQGSPHQQARVGVGGAALLDL